MGRWVKNKGRKEGCIMWDQYDIQFGLSRKTKKTIMYSIWMVVVNAVIIRHFLIWDSFIGFSMPRTYGEVLGGLATISLLGLALYSLVLVRTARKEVGAFRRGEKKWMCIGENIQKEQKERILHTLRERIDKYENGEAEIFYLNRMADKVSREQSLTDNQVEYLNHLLFRNEEKKPFSV
jgi:hypothetical protein